MEAEDGAALENAAAKMLLFWSRPLHVLVVDLRQWRLKMVQRWRMQRQRWYFSGELGGEDVKASDNVAAEMGQCQIMGRQMWHGGK